MRVRNLMTQDAVLEDIVVNVELELNKLKEMIALQTSEQQVLSQANIVSQGLGYIESYLTAKEFNRLM